MIYRRFLDYPLHYLDVNVFLFLVLSFSFNFHLIRLFKSSLHECSVSFWASENPTVLTILSTEFVESFISNSTIYITHGTMLLWVFKFLKGQKGKKITLHYYMSYAYTYPSTFTWGYTWYNVYITKINTKKWREREWMNHFGSEENVWNAIRSRTLSNHDI